MTLHPHDDLNSQQYQQPYHSFRKINPGQIPFELQTGKVGDDRTPLFEPLL